MRGNQTKGKRYVMDLIERSAAIDAINDLPNCPNGYSDTYDKASIISALEDVPSAQPEKRTETHACDCISRQAAIECLEHLSACDEPFVEIGIDDETSIGKYEAITEISDLPSAMEDETKNVERREE